MMQLLADITKMAIDKHYITYEDLYFYDEKQLFCLFKEIHDLEFKELLHVFANIKKENVPVIDLPHIKIRDLKPLVNGKE